MDLDLLKEIEEIVSKLHVIPSTKQYWLIRTQSGLYYDSFRKNGFVAIGHDDITLYDLNTAKKKFPADGKKLQREIRDIAARKYEDGNEGLIAGQVYRFIFELTKGDIVIIPSENSDVISFGVVTSDIIPELSARDIEETDCPFRKRKSVEWVHDIYKSKLDPYMFKMFQAHQAINNVSAYKDVIERTIGNFFVREDEASLVLMVEKETDISAKSLFDLGHYLLEYSNQFIINNELPLSIDSIDVKINVNSIGKIQLSSKDKRTIWLVALLGIVVVGGGLKIDTAGFKMDLSTNGLIQKAIDYQNNSQDREIRQKLVDSMDSLKVQPPQDALNMLKQFSTNKDNPK
jgi:restriction system protein